MCACEIYAKHPNHKNKHTFVEMSDYVARWEECRQCGIKRNVENHAYSYEYRSEIYHAAVCDLCGYEYNYILHEYKSYANGFKVWEECECGHVIINHYHSFNYIIINGEDGEAYHEAYCEYCQYEKYDVHEYIATPVSPGYHNYKCVCGRTSGSAVEHTASQYEYKTKLIHNIVCECGYVMGTSPHSVVTDGPMKSHCSDCGAVFNTGSDIIIKRKEDELYTE